MVGSSLPLALDVPTFEANALAVIGMLVILIPAAIGGLYTIYVKVNPQLTELQKALDAHRKAIAVNTVDIQRLRNEVTQSGSTDLPGNPGTPGAGSGGPRPGNVGTGHE